jgi:hypothetical protein
VKKTKKISLSLSLSLSGRSSFPKQANFFSQIAFQGKEKWEQGEDAYPKPKERQHSIS